LPLSLRPCLRGDSHRLSRIVFNSNLLGYLYYNRVNVSLG
jgi:hypothetical protein